MDQRRIKKILVYTHNSIGLGHAVRTLSVITGIRKSRPDIEFMVLSGTSVPQLFFKEGIELVKLPSTRLDIEPDGQFLRPRYLPSLNLE
ncbi:MAG: hypothetical protein JRJ59_02975, partial [Deltaproteobacteria bacterium]|nr:hypothetical protein [Deltaproteobacteria bacterium]